MWPEVYEQEARIIYMEMVDGKAVEVNAELPEIDQDANQWDAILHKVAGVTLEEIVEAIRNAVRKISEWEQTVTVEGTDDIEKMLALLEEETREIPRDVTERGRKEAREKQRAVERAESSRFRQYRISETTRTMKKRTGPRGREWKGADRM